MKIASLLLCLAAGVTLAATPDSPAVALRCGRLLDVQSGDLIENAIILMSGGKVTAVGAGLAIPPGAQVVQLPEATCLPGLIDVHVHLTMNPTDAGYEALGISVPRSTVTGVRNARRTLLAGFTTVRNVGADGYSDVALRDGIEAGDIDGPRMFVSGPALGITGGHCDNNLLAPEFHYTAPSVADGPWAARAKVREVIKYGADVIKICASGGVLSKGDQPGTPQYTLEEMQAIADEAHKLGRKVAAHAHGTQSIKDAIRAGIDSVEHSSLIDDEGIALAKQHLRFWCSTSTTTRSFWRRARSTACCPNPLRKSAGSANCNARISGAPCWAGHEWRSVPMRESIPTATMPASSPS
jgi:imidazolonepropionase-like amidohydrolase